MTPEEIAKLARELVEATCRPSWSVASEMKRQQMVMNTIDVFAPILTARLAAREAEYARLREAAKARPVDILQSRSRGVMSIDAERARQMVREGYSLDHDDTHDKGEMAISAGCYALAGLVSDEILAEMWPFGSCEWKPKSRMRDLVRAGALIAAEIDRLLRSESAIKPQQEQGK